MRIGLVDLDTSHPGKWTPIIRDLGHEVAAVWDGGTVHPDGYAAEFASEHSVAATPETLDEMVPLVDAAIIHSCNWDLHVERAAPFVEADKAIFLDKPIVGNHRDARQVLDWLSGGKRLTGGSSLRYAYEARDFLQQPVEKRGSPHIVLGGCGSDEFNYGIHGYALVWAIMGGGAQSVRWLGRSPVQEQAEIVWQDGRRAIINFTRKGDSLPFWATVLTESAVYHIMPDTGKIYRALLERVLGYLAGHEERPPVPHEELIEPELAAIAARASRRRGGEAIALRDLGLDEEGYDGAAFAAEYRNARLAAR